MIKFKRNHKDAKLPVQHSKLAAGFDLHSIETGVVLPGMTVIFDTGIAMAIPIGCMGQVSPRSGLAFKKGVICVQGVIDPDFTGSIKVMLINYGRERLIVKKGARIAQIVFHKIMTESCEVESLDDTERGNNGFGSTGI
jgi:dUTP pyrophosphatase